MPALADRKLYLGPRLRVLRRELGINQTRMAEELGISPSYLNHLERNQRPLTAQMLLKLANTYDIDIRSFVSGSDGAASGLSEIFADDLLRDIGVPRHEIMEVAESYPAVSEAITRLYGALVDHRRRQDTLEALEGGGRVASSPIDWLRQFVEQHGNHFPDLEHPAEALAAELGDDPAERQLALRERLKRHGVTVRAMPDRVMLGALRHYDFHRKRLMLSERLPFPSQSFAMAFQLAAVELAEPVAALLAQAAPPDDERRRLVQIALANYAAGALLMPYERFRQAAEAARYDLELLETRFGVSFEQLAHRLTTLHRPGARGIPFFMLKVDVAGTISKRFAGEGFPFARFGGACPRWDLHACFRRPGELLAQIIETPDGKRYCTLSRTVARSTAPDARSQSAIGLGCDVKHADRLAYPAFQPGQQQVVTVGPTCHLCEREACPDRALPPITRSLQLNPHERTTSPYPFRRV